MLFYTDPTIIREQENEQNLSLATRGVLATWFIRLIYWGFRQKILSEDFPFLFRVGSVYFTMKRQTVVATYFICQIFVFLN
jgi:hypothetical protein